jgi:hypothetical protein
MDLYFLMNFERQVPQGGVGNNINKSIIPFIFYFIKKIFLLKNAGATSASLIARQFLDLKRGNRFHFENTDASTNPYPFTTAQINEIRRQTFSRLICNHICNVCTTFQSRVLRVADNDRYVPKTKQNLRLFQMRVCD